MQKQFRRALFIFRRDLRIIDNHGLSAAMETSCEVVPCFIFDPSQIEKRNTYKSNNAIQFMITSLFDLYDQIKKHHGELYFFIGDPAKVVSWAIKEFEVDAVFCNKDYTPFSNNRDKQILDSCGRYGVPFIQHDDALLTGVDAIKTGSGTPYGVYTPFFNTASKTEIENPRVIKRFCFYKKTMQSGSHVLSIDAVQEVVLRGYWNDSLAVTGGSKQGHELLKKACSFATYLQDRDFPIKTTTHLSAHFKFGTISIRQAYYAFLQAGTHGTKALIRQLFWRDFFTYIAFHSPHVFGHAYRKQYDHIEWHNNEHLFKKWCAGETGFPLVDAGMRQLNQTGFMHGRARMVTASFLVKDLHIDWKWGEQYFATQLVDYDPAVNNGNWQWVASTGSDSQPYFRVFNPMLQQKKFDPDAEYIKKWVPELQYTDIKTIHALGLGKATVKGYPYPVVDHTKEIAITKKMYQKKQSY